MHRKTLSLFLLVFVVVSLTLVGCRRSASPSLDELPPEDETAAMIEDAGSNTADSQPGDTQADVTKEPVEKETVAVAEATEEPTEKETEVVPTPVPTKEATPEPTKEATPEPTPSPTEAPAETSEPTPEPIIVQAPGTHTVQAGENLFRIALRYSLSVDALAQANGITNPALVYVGQVLKIPSGPGDTPPPPPPSSDGEKTHVVQPGENLFRIALKYNYDQYYLARYNGIENPALIYVGQVIRIP